MTVFTLYYFVFLAVTMVLYYLTTHKFRPYVLLVFSLIFIGSISIKLAIFSLLFTLANFFFGIVLASYKDHPEKKIKWFWTFIGLDIATLSFFKYASGILNGLDSLVNKPLFPHLDIVIPLGISYYTFQALGYLIRISRGSEEAQRDFGSFSIYLLFFPKFLSGPVERSNHFFPQLKKEVKFTYQNFSEGVRLILWGLFKKILIANNLYPVIQTVYGNVHDYKGVSLILVFFIQAVYMYADFSGYTDIAMGSARLFGLDIIDNFKRPFLAKNVSDYWRRWHISLSSWCNDFIYNPLIVKYRQFGNTAVIMGILITFFVMGIWHGANWTYVTLGLLQAVAIIYEFHTKKYRLKYASRFSKPTVNTISRILVFLFASFSMIFFYARTIGDSWYFLTHLGSGIHLDGSGFGMLAHPSLFGMAVGLFLVIFVLEMYMEKGKNLLAQFLQKPRWVHWITYAAVIVLIYFFRSQIGTFYYMRF
ncbi:MAG: MBOAT family protein [Bacteroidota bacterium]|nr:MBOAT family protein [Bacteroidota bacterium]